MNIKQNIESYVDKIQVDGYVILKNIIDPFTVNSILSFIKGYQYTEIEKEKIAISKMRLNEYADNLFNVALKKPEYLRYFIRGLQGDIAKYLLNDEYYRSIPSEFPNYILRSMLARSSKGEMPYHIDNFIPYQGAYSSVIQMVIFLEKSDENTGCTKVVKGSHLSGLYAPQNNNNEILLECEPGDIIIWDSRLWHATTENKTDKTRWALICTFCRWYIKQGFDYPRAISLETYKKLDLDERIVFGYASKVPLDELERTEVKGSIETIKE